VGRVTEEREHPLLTVRHWVGSNPKRLVVDHQHQLNLEVLHAHHIQSLIVEGGRRTLEWFIAQGLWDELRVETAPLTVTDGTRAPQIPAEARLHRTNHYHDNVIATYRKNA